MYSNKSLSINGRIYLHFGRIYRQCGRVYRQNGRIRRQLDAFVDNLWKKLNLSEF